MSVALITGGSGHVGANLVRELTEKGYKIRTIDFDGDHRAFEGFDVELVKGDITDYASLQEVFKDVDVVFFCPVKLDRRYSGLIRRVNVDGTKNVCEELLRLYKKVYSFFFSRCFLQVPNR